MVNQDATCCQRCDVRVGAGATRVPVAIGNDYGDSIELCAECWATYVWMMRNWLIGVGISLDALPSREREGSRPIAQAREE